MRTLNGGLATVSAAIELANAICRSAFVVVPSWRPRTSRTPMMLAPSGCAGDASLQQIAQWAQSCSPKDRRKILPRTCLGNTVTELLEIVEPFDRETVGVCLDTNHFMRNYQSVPDAVRQMAGRLLSFTSSITTGSMSNIGFRAAVSSIGHGSWRRWTRSATTVRSCTNARSAARTVEHDLRELHMVEPSPTPVVVAPTFAGVTPAMQTHARFAGTIAARMKRTTISDVAKASGCPRPPSARS